MDRNCSKYFLLPLCRKSWSLRALLISDSDNIISQIRSSVELLQILHVCKIKRQKSKPIVKIIIIIY